MSAELREQIRRDKEIVDLADALNRISQTSEFQKVITDHLFTHKPDSLISQLAHLDKNSIEYHQIIRELDAISYLRKYFVDLVDSGEIALESIKEAQTINE